MGEHNIQGVDYVFLEVLVLPQKLEGTPPQYVIHSLKKFHKWRVLDGDGHN